MGDIIKKYRARAKALGYSDEQSDEIIHRLSAIMCAFIDAAWGAHPVQLAGNSGGNKALPRLPEYVKIGTKAKQGKVKGSATKSAEE